MTTHETTARLNHRTGCNCAQSVAAAFAEELDLSPAEAMRAAPRPRSEGGKCGAYLTGLRLLEALKPSAAAEYKRRFLEENGAIECALLRRKGCNDLVGCAARLVEELMK